MAFKILSVLVDISETSIDHILTIIGDYKLEKPQENRFFMN